MPVAIQQKLLPPNTDTRIVPTPANQYKEETRHLVEQGYTAIGVADFQGPAPTQRQIFEQGKKAGADVVLFASELMGTQQGVRPIVTYQPGQTYNTTEYGTVNANAYGSGGYSFGYGTYSGSATTTSPGTFNTQYVPYQYRVYQTAISFWRRMKLSIFGARLKPIPDDLRKTLQRNTGAYVDIIIQDSPAFKANILSGDVIIQIADKPVTTVPDFIGDLPAYAGQKVPIKLIRNGQTLDVDVQLNENEQ